VSESNQNPKWYTFIQKFFEPKSGSQSLDYTNKLRLLRFKVFLRGFIIGFILYPWVWVWGGWILLVGLVSYLLSTDYFVYVTYRNSLPFPVSGIAKGQGYEWSFVCFLGLAFFVNYTISYLTYRKNPALGVLMCILSLGLLLIAYFYIYLLWQYNLSLHG
jgi:hypothetical protein